MKTMMLSISQDAKTVKGEKRGYRTAVLYLAPSTLSGRNVCPNATPGCIAACLNTAGRGVFNSVQQARINKTHEFSEDPQAFLWNVAHEITLLVKRCHKDGYTPLVRLNGTSDIPWENVFSATHGIAASPAAATNLFRMFPHVQFYDYTKSLTRMMRFLQRFLQGRADESHWPANYHLTFSRSESNGLTSLGVLEKGGNVAVVFDTKKGQRLPFEWHGYPVVDGDRDDVRHTAGRGVVIGLRAKGKARKDASRFVVKTGDSDV